MRKFPVLVTFDLFSALLDSRTGASAVFDTLARQRGWPWRGISVYDDWDRRNKRLQRDVTGWPRVFALSALEALEAAIRNDRHRLSVSGLPALRHLLEEFLTTDKTGLFLRNVADRAATLVAAQSQDLRLGQLALDHSPRVSEILAAFDARMTELGSQQRRAVARISGVIDARLPGRIAARSETWQADFRQLIADAMPDASGADGGLVGGLVDEGRARLERAGQQVTGPWLNQRAGEVRELLTTMAADEIGTLVATATAPRRAGAEIARLTARQQDDQGATG